MRINWVLFWGDGNERKRKSLSGIFGKEEEIGRREIVKNKFFFFK